MASLTETSIIARKVIRYVIYCVVLIIILRFTINLGVSIYHKFVPPPEPEPTVAFGKLPKLPFPERPTLSNLTYTLETPDGKLPLLPEQAEVYFMPPLASNIRALDSAKEKASALGFNPNGRLLVENVPNVYIFQKSIGTSTLTMNIISGVFSISYDLTVDPSVIGNLPPGPDAAVGQARSYLGNAGLLQEDTKESRTSYEFLRIENGKFVPAVSLSEAAVIKVNIFRKDYGKEIPAVTPEGKEANIWFMLSGAGTRQVIAAEYHYFPIDLQKSGTYPLKTSEAAWEELKNGGAFITTFKNTSSTNVTIRRVYLGYYDAGQYAEFYQPVVVFEGDDDFIAYVPAIVPNFYGGEE